MRILLALVLLSVGVSVTAQEKGDPGVYVKSGVHTGQSYMAAGYEQRVGYAAGLLDGLLLAPLMGGRGEVVERLRVCVIGMSDTQLAAILDKYTQENPSRWHQPMNIIGYSAIILACPKTP